MKNKFLRSIAFLGLTALVLTSCSKLPQEEIDAANLAIEQAKTSGAEIYANESFVALQDSFKNVMVGVEAQKSKFIKNYTTTKEQLAGVTQFAGEVAQKAETRKEEMKAEIQNTIVEVKTLIESNRQLAEQAPKGKEGASALVAIKGEIDMIEASITETSALLETGDYIATLDKARIAKEKATSINVELTEVIAKYNSNVKTKKS